MSTSNAAKTTLATFDGASLKLEDVSGLEEGKRYRVVIEAAEKSADPSSLSSGEKGAQPEPPPLEEKYAALLDIANEIGFTDFAEKHLKNQ